MAKNEEIIDALKEENEQFKVMQEKLQQQLTDKNRNLESQLSEKLSQHESVSTEKLLLEQKLESIQSANLIQEQKLLQQEKHIISITKELEQCQIHLQRVMGRKTDVENLFKRVLEDIQGLKNQAEAEFNSIEGVEEIQMTAILTQGVRPRMPGTTRHYGMANRNFTWE